MITLSSPQSVYVFVSERLAPLSVAGYQRMVARTGEAAGFPFAVHSHMLRHSCGYKLANDGQDTRAIQHYLGHRSITSTVFIYRSLASAMDLEEFGAGSGFLSRPDCIVPAAAT